MLQQGTAKRSAMQSPTRRAARHHGFDRGDMDDPAWDECAHEEFPAYSICSPTSSFTPRFRRKKSTPARRPLAALANDRGEPNVIVSRTGVAALFGPHHPFGYDNTGTENRQGDVARGHDEFLAKPLCRTMRRWLVAGISPGTN